MSDLESEIREYYESRVERAGLAPSKTFAEALMRFRHEARCLLGVDGIGAVIVSDAVFERVKIEAARECNYDYEMYAVDEIGIAGIGVIKGDD